MINSSLSSSVKVAPLPKNEYDFAVSMQHRLNTPIQVHSVAKPFGMLCLFKVLPRATQLA